MTSLQKFEYWKANCKDEGVRLALKAMEGDLERIDNAFFKDIEFGTAGIRGLLDAGSNCLNVYTIAMTTKGIADYMNDHGYSKAVICRDCRNFSDEFTFVTARVFASCGIEATITHDIMPTPFLSYAVRETGADIGIMITASHNPPEYNGYKVYNKYGYQLTDEAALQIADYIKRVEPFGIVYDSLEHYLRTGDIKYLGEDVTASYLFEVQSMSLKSKDGISVVYSPLNGAGYKLVPEILRICGVRDLLIVDAQSQPDGNFPTCKKPNPEKKEALELGIELAKREDFDIVLATDPDADRLGVAVKHDGDYRLLTGNETGALLTDYVFSSLKKSGKLAKKPLLIKTIVTTPLAAEIAKSYGGECVDVLTGFKYIGEKITELEKRGEKERFVLGFEESYGYLVGSYVRDKDAVVASMLVAEMAAVYKKEGITLVDKLEELYAKFGTYQHKIFSLEYAGAAGARKMKELLDGFRSAIPKSYAGFEVISVTDYLKDETGLPKANVIKIDTKAGSRIIIRPSGTEPLIKFYITASKTNEENKKQIDEITKALEAFFKS